jgi:HEAT repeat protein
VDELRRVLQAPVGDLQVRDRQVKHCLARLHELADLASALALHEWRDEDVNPQVASVDRANRAALLQHFEREVRRLLETGDPASQVAVADLLATVGAASRGAHASESLGRRFTLDLVGLLPRGDTFVRQSAARTLGRIHPDPAIALPALGELLGAAEVAERRAGAEALRNMVDVLSQLTARTRNASGVQVRRPEVAETAAGIVRVAGRGLADDDPQVRRACAAAVRQAAGLLGRIALDPPASVQEGRLAWLAQQQREMLPLVTALGEQGTALARAFRDVNAEVRWLAGQTLEEMAQMRRRWLDVGEGTDPDGVAQMLMQGLRPALPDLADALNDPDLRTRLATLDVLESLGAEAVLVAPPVVRALQDPNRFVRRSAARVLGKVAPAAPALIVPALANLLTDPDPDLCLAAASALERYGPAAGAAVPALLRSADSRQDVEARLAALRVVTQLEVADAAPTLPLLRSALADPDARVRQLAARGLGRLGAAAQAAIEDLRRARTDPSPAVQQAAADALLGILQAAGE